MDEADSMTHAAQAALRRTMECEMKTTRFCLICNYVSRIIEPITSRCTKFRFKPLNEALILERLRYICDQEQVTCDDECLNALVKASGGDLRRAITCLQSCARLRGSSSPISIKDVHEVTGVITFFYSKIVLYCENRKLVHNNIIFKKIIPRALFQAFHRSPKP